mmetsp:Transcript_4141/g.13470  ORF Transcript_4141/g.13470 Transcript_4141/m.13470 type:complete len:241 (-) Transcript_4141:1858-2580(-)
MAFVFSGVDVHSLHRKMSRFFRFTLATTLPTAHSWHFVGCFGFFGRLRLLEPPTLDPELSDVTDCTPEPTDDTDADDEARSASGGESVPLAGATGDEGRRSESGAPASLGPFGLARSDEVGEAAARPGDASMFRSRSTADARFSDTLRDTPSGPPAGEPAALSPASPEFELSPIADEARAIILLPRDRGVLDPRPLDDSLSGARSETCGTTTPPGPGQRRRKSGERTHFLCAVVLHTRQQ